MNVVDLERVEAAVDPEVVVAAPEAVAAVLVAVEALEAEEVPEEVPEVALEAAREVAVA